MARYFIEVSYLGSSYAGFQIQENAKTIQGELELALATILRKKITLTGSSRTDAGVHAFQNYFHFDYSEGLSGTLCYNLNSLLPKSIAVKRILQLHDEAHSRFDAVSRQYRYTINHWKSPFLGDRSYYYPYPLSFELLEEASLILLKNADFSSFSKKGTQVKTSICRLEYSYWEKTDSGVIYNVKGNRFLRGMVRGMVGTMLKVGRGKLTINNFKELVLKGDPQRADFAVPGHGLTLIHVAFPPSFGL